MKSSHLQENQYTHQKFIQDFLSNYEELSATVKYIIYGCKLLVHRQTQK